MAIAVRRLGRRSALGWLGCSLAVLPVASLAAGCGVTPASTQTGPRVLTAIGNAARKVVVMRKDTPVYADNGLSQQVDVAQTWHTWFVYDLTARSGPTRAYQVARIIGAAAGDLRWLDAAHVLEWNTVLTLNLKNSPEIAGRPPLKYYATPEQARAQRGDVVLEEKAVHRPDFDRHVDPQPILRDLNGVYEVAMLYDTAPGVAKKESTFDTVRVVPSAFTLFDAKAHEIRRFVNRAELGRYLRAHLDDDPEAPRNPTDLDRAFGKLLDLLGYFASDMPKGIREIEELFKQRQDGRRVPGDLEVGPFSPGARSGQDPERFQGARAQIAAKAWHAYSDPAYWDERGYGFVPVEWL